MHASDEISCTLQTVDEEIRNVGFVPSVQQWSEHESTFLPERERPMGVWWSNSESWPLLDATNLWVNWQPRLWFWDCQGKQNWWNVSWNVGGLEDQIIAFFYMALTRYGWSFLCATPRSHVLCSAPPCDRKYVRVRVVTNGKLWLWRKDMSSQHSPLFQLVGAYWAWISSCSLGASLFERPSSLWTHSCRVTGYHRC